LKSKGVTFTDIDVSGNPALRQDMEQRSGRHTVPQIWIGTTHVGGCDDLYALERQGKLDALLQG
jgi:glutaredoxin 3